MKQGRELARHDCGLESIALRDDGVVVSCGRDGNVRVGDRIVLEGKRARVVAVAGDAILVGTQSCRVFRLRDGVVDEPFGKFEDTNGGVGAIATDGTHVAIGAGLSDFAIHLLDGTRIWIGSTYKWPYAVAIGGRKIACATWQPDLHVVDLDALPPSGKDLYGDYPGAGPVFDLAFLPDGRIVTVGATDEAGFIRIGDRALDTEEGQHAVVVIGDRIVVGGNDQKLTVYDFELRKHEELVLGQPWSSRGDEIPTHAPFYSASGDDAVIDLWARGDAVIVATHGGRVLEVPH